MEYQNHRQEEINRHIIAALLYFDIFSHPLTATEIHQFLQAKISYKTLQASLQTLAENAIIYKNGTYYSIENTPKTVERRIEANQRAIQRMKTALRNSKSMAKLPFVKGVFLSGTIAKGVMYEDSDIDFFVVTSTNKLWLAKMSMKVFKLVFLRNSRQDFCYNYLLSEDNLEIEEQNLYTATELITLIPTYNYDLYQLFLSKNQWYKNYFPNWQVRSEEHIVSTTKSKRQAIFEKTLNNRFGNWLNKRFMRYVQKEYARKYHASLTPDERAIALKTTTNVSKVHPHHYQKQFLIKYEEKLAKFEAKHDLNINKRVAP